MNEIKGIAHVKFLPGKLEEWKRLTEQAIEIVRTEIRGNFTSDQPKLFTPWITTKDELAG